jgi:hypothetical protein
MADPAKEKSNEVPQPIAKIVTKDVAFWTEAYDVVSKQLEGLEKSMKLQNVIAAAVKAEMQKAVATQKAQEVPK